MCSTGKSYAFQANLALLTVGVDMLSDWKFYQSTDTLYCPANRQLKLSLASGGIVAGAMLVDLIEIIEVK